MDRIPELLDAGRSTAEIADLLDTTPGAVRAWASRNGVSVVRDNGYALRDEVEREIQDMTASDALRHCLDVIEILSPGQSEFVVLASDDHGVHLTPHERRVVSELEHSLGRVVSKEHLMNVLYANRGDDIPEVKIIDVYVCKIRKKLPDDFPFRIETVWGFGYKMVRCNDH